MIQRIIIICAAALFIFNACTKDSTTPITVAKESYILPGDTLFPEGIAYQAQSGYFFTGSTTSGDILRVDVQTGNAAVFATGKTQGRNAATGLRLDSKDRLWVCGGADAKISVLDASGALLKLWDIKAMFGGVFINDCISDGSYINFTDSKVQKLYRTAVSGDPGTMEEWLTFSNTQIPYDPAGTNANGIVITPDNQYLIMVVSTSGKLYRIKIADKSIAEITLNTTVKDGDGLYLDGTKLYVSRNSTGLVFPVTMSAAYDNGTVGTGFGSNLKFNTTMARAGDYLLIVNGQLDKRTGRTQTLPFTVTRVSIP